MNFIIIDNKNTRWAYGNTEDKGTFNFQSICKYLMGCLHPEIFTIIFFDSKEIIKRVSLVEYMGM